MPEDTAQERTEQATPKRLREARERGEVPRSRELNTLVVLLGGAGGLMLLGGYGLGHLLDVLEQGLHPRLWRDSQAMVGEGAAMALHALLALAPFFALMVLLAFLAPLALGGWAMAPVAFKGERMSLGKGLGRMFSRRGLIELAKALAKFALIAGVAVAWLWYRSEAFLALGAEPLFPALADAARLLGMTFLVLTVPLILIAAIDVPIQLWDHARKLRMTRQEVRDEFKDTEGKPEVKSRLRAMQQEIARRRMMAQVPKADAVIVNPSHYAVALAYAPARMKAPVVVAKGADWLALQIRNIAQAHGVPVVESPALARALYHSAEIDRPIPTALYLAVAQVLAYVFELRKRGTLRRPVRLPDVPVPGDFP